MKGLIFIILLTSVALKPVSVFAQCQSGDCNNGYGTILLENGNYTGHFVNGAKDGEGKYTWNMGVTYEGTWKNNIMAKGIAKMTYPEGNWFIGEVKEGGITTDSGIFYYKDGTIDMTKGYGKTGDVHPELTQGCILGNCVNGFGVCTYTDGAKYEGVFVKGNRSGQGIYTWKSGEKYKGNWNNGIMYGLGESVFADGTKYVGGYADGKLNGYGTYYYANGTIDKTRGFALVDNDFENEINKVQSDAYVDFKSGLGPEISNYECRDKGSKAYKCLYNFKNAISCRIEKNAASKYTVVVEYYSGTDQKAAEEIYNNLVSKLKIALRGQAFANQGGQNERVKGVEIYQADNYNEVYSTVNPRMDKINNKYLVLIEFKLKTN